MSSQHLKQNIDPTHADYAYTANPLVPVFGESKGAKKVANLFIGEWVKILDDPIPAKGRVHVRFRGGMGYVAPESLTRTRYLEIYFIDVNQGDSILIQTPDDRRILIDGGESGEAHTFIRRKYNLDKKENYIDFEAVIATHSDSDHTRGLVKVLKDPKIAVRRFYHNGLFRRQDKKRDPGKIIGQRIYDLLDSPRLNEKPGLSPLMRSIVQATEEARERLPRVIEKMRAMPRYEHRGVPNPPEGGMVFQRLDAAAEYLPPFSLSPGQENALTIRVLWPSAKKAEGQLSYPNYGNASRTVNGNSIVLCLSYGRHRILLTGDLNEQAMTDMINKSQDLVRADVYKAAHHGSQDFSLEFLKAVRPDAAVISSGDNRQDAHGHPRAVLLGTITRYSVNPRPAVFSTELAACYSPVALNKKQKDAFNEGKLKKYGGSEQVYEKSLNGVVHLRSDGQALYLGTVHGRRAPEDNQAATCYKWDIWPVES